MDAGTFAEVGCSDRIFYMNRIINGDSFELLPRMEAESVHLAVTDPPYHLDGLDAGWKKGHAKAKRATGTVGGLPVGMKFDPEQGRNLQVFMRHTGHALMHVLKPGGFACAFSFPRLAHRAAVGLEEAGFEIRDLLAWRFTKRAQFKAFGMDHFIDRMALSEDEKENIKARLKDRKTPQLRPKFECIILAQKPREGTFVENYLKHGVGLINARASMDDFVPSTIMTAENPTSLRRTSILTVKPLSLIKHLIDLLSEPGQLVLDPFVGSGTTSLAAMQLQRNCIGIEINEEYAAYAQRRIDAYAKWEGTKDDI